MTSRSRLAAFAFAVAAAVGIGAAAGAVLGPLGVDSPAGLMPADHDMTGDD